MPCCLAVGLWRSSTLPNVHPLLYAMQQYGICVHHMLLVYMKSRERSTPYTTAVRGQPPVSQHRQVQMPTPPLRSPPSSYSALPELHTCTLHLASRHT